MTINIEDHALSIVRSVDGLMELCHTLSKDAGWWIDQKTGEPLIDNPFIVAVKLMLAVTEIAEACEGDRRNLMDNHLPKFKSIAVELSDVLIRVYDLAGALNLPLGEAFAAKLAYNHKRPDHKPENRQKKHGKKY